MASSNLPPKEEFDQFSAVFDPTLIEGKRFNLLSNDWFLAWCEYTGFDPETHTVQSNQINSSNDAENLPKNEFANIGTTFEEEESKPVKSINQSVKSDDASGESSETQSNIVDSTVSAQTKPVKTRPGPWDNTALCSMINQTSPSIPVTDNQRYYVLHSHLQEHTDFVFINEPAYQLLLQWYDHPINQSTDQSDNQSASDDSSEHPAKRNKRSDQHVDQATSQLASQSTVESVKKPVTRCGPHIVRSVIARGLTEELVIELHPLSIFVRFVDIDGTIFDPSISPINQFNHSVLSQLNADTSMTHSASKPTVVANEPVAMDASNDDSINQPITPSGDQSGNQTNASSPNQSAHSSLYQSVTLHTVSRDWTLRQLADGLRPDNQSNDHRVYPSIWPKGVMSEGRIWVNIYPAKEPTTTQPSNQSPSPPTSSPSSSPTSESKNQSVRWELLHEREYQTSVEMIDWLNGTEIALEYQIPLVQSADPVKPSPTPQQNNRSSVQPHQRINTPPTGQSISQPTHRWCRSSDPRFVPFNPTNPSVVNTIHWKVGDTVDARDTQFKWFESTIMQIDQSINQSADQARVFVHFKGWAEKWNEWLTVDTHFFSQSTDQSLNPSTIQSVKFNRVAPQSFFTTGARDPSKLASTGQSFTQSSNQSKYATEGSSVARGCVGLQNLGNTCFMNSIIQSINQSPILTDYLLGGNFRVSINQSNPLGFGGKIAMSYADLVADMWAVPRSSNQSLTASNQSNNLSSKSPNGMSKSPNPSISQSRGRYSLIAPRIFKQQIGLFQPRFSGYQQHDSSEFLSFLLDGLHEDLNRVIDKPRTEPVDYAQLVNRYIASYVDRLIKHAQSKLQPNHQSTNSLQAISPSNSLVNLSITQSPSQSVDQSADQEMENSDDEMTQSKQYSRDGKSLQLHSSVNTPHLSIDPAIGQNLNQSLDSALYQSIYARFKLNPAFADALVARESWDRFLERNQSIITDHFMGQFKSTLICPECDNKSITFDPFQFVSLPLVNQSTTQSLKICFVPTAKTSRLLRMTDKSTSLPIHRPINLSLDLPIQPTAFDAKQSLIKLVNETVNQSSGSSPATQSSNRANRTITQPNNPWKVDLRSLLLVQVKDNRIVKAMKDNTVIEINQPKTSKYAYHQSNTNIQSSQPVYWMYEIPELMHNLPGTKIEEYQAQAVAVMLSDDLNDSQPQSNDQSVSSSPGRSYKHVSPPVFPAVITIPSSWINDCSIDGLFEKMDRAISAFVNQPVSQSSDDSAEHSNDEVHNEPSTSSNTPAINQSINQSTEADVQMTDEPSVKQEPTDASLDQSGNQCVQSIKPELVSIQPKKRTIKRSTSQLKYHLVICDKSGVQPLHTVTRPSADDTTNQSIDLVHLQRTRGLSFSVIFPSNNSSVISPADFHSHPSYHQSINQSNNPSVNRPLNLDDCFDAFSRPEVLRPSEAWYCPTCKKHQQAMKQMMLFKLPDCLLIQLKRFSFTSTNRQKIDRLIEFPIEGLQLHDYSQADTANVFVERPSVIEVDGHTIDVTAVQSEEQKSKNQSISQSINQTSSKSPVKSKDPTLVEYDLYAVSQHYGGLGGGHYTAVVKNLRNNQWYSMDDSSVTPINQSIKQAVVTPAAYVLFYKKKNLVTPDWRQKKFRQTKD